MKYKSDILYFTSVQDGTNGINGTNGKDGVDGKNGIDGKDGVDGITPHIKDGYWYIGDDRQGPARGEEALTLSLSNDRDVVAIRQDGSVVGDLPTVTPLLTRNGVTVTGLTITLDQEGIPEPFKNTAYYSYTNGVLSIKGIPAGFTEGKFVFTYSNLVKEFTLSTTQSEVDYNLHIAKTLINNTGVTTADNKTFSLKIKATDASGKVTYINNYSASNPVQIYLNGRLQTSWNIQYTENSTPMTFELRANSNAGFLWDSETVEFVTNGAKGEATWVAQMINENHTFPGQQTYASPGSSAVIGLSASYGTKIATLNNITTSNRPEALNVVFKETKDNIYWYTIQVDQTKKLSSGGYIDFAIQAKTSDGKSADLTKRFVYSIAFKGAPGTNGANGADAVTYEIIPEKTSLHNSFTPFKVSAYKITGSSRTACSGYWRVFDQDNNKLYPRPTATDSQTDTFDLNNLNGSIYLLYATELQICFALNQGDTSYVDSQTVLILKDGKNGADGVWEGIKVSEDSVELDTDGGTAVYDPNTISIKYVRNVGGAEGALTVDWLVQIDDNKGQEYENDELIITLDQAAPKKKIVVTARDSDGSALETKIIWIKEEGTTEYVLYNSKIVSNVNDLPRLENKSYSDYPAGPSDSNEAISSWYKTIRGDSVWKRTKNCKPSKYLNTSWGDPIRMSGVLSTYEDMYNALDGINKDDNKGIYQLPNEDGTIGHIGVSADVIQTGAINIGGTKEKDFKDAQLYASLSKNEVYIGGWTVNEGGLSSSDGNVGLYSYDDWKAPSLVGNPSAVRFFSGISNKWQVWATLLDSADSDGKRNYIITVGKQGGETRQCQVTASRNNIKATEFTWTSSEDPRVLSVFRTTGSNLQLTESSTADGIWGVTNPNYDDLSITIQPVMNYCVLDDGSFYANAAQIKGHIEATSGSIGPLKIGNIPQDGYVATSVDSNFSWKFSPSDGLFMWNGRQQTSTTDPTRGALFSIYKKDNEYKLSMKGHIEATSGSIGPLNIGDIPQDGYVATNTNGSFSWRFSPTQGMFMWDGQQVEPSATNPTGGALFSIYKDTNNKYKLSMKGHINAESGNFKNLEISYKKITDPLNPDNRNCDREYALRFPSKWYSGSSGITYTGYNYIGPAGLYFQGLGGYDSGSGVYIDPMEMFIYNASDKKKTHLSSDSIFITNEGGNPYVNSHLDASALYFTRSSGSGYSTSYGIGRDSTGTYLINNGDKVYVSDLVFKKAYNIKAEMDGSRYTIGKIYHLGTFVYGFFISNVESNVTKINNKTYWPDTGQVITIWDSNGQTAKLPGPSKGQTILWDYYFKDTIEVVISKNTSGNLQMQFGDKNTPAGSYSINHWTYFCYSTNINYQPAWT